MNTKMNTTSNYVNLWVFKYFPSIVQSRVKGIDGGYKLSKLTIRKNNHLSWEDLPLFKNSLKLFKFESAIIYCHANSLISLIAQREHTCIFTDTLCVSLGALCELGRSV